MSQTHFFERNEAKSKPLRKRHLVLVDDDVNYGSLIKGLIKDYPVLFSYFNSLLRFTEDNSVSYDIILLDYQMKSVDGVQAAQYIKKFFPKTPILLISGGLLDEHVESWPTNLKAFLPKHIGPLQVVTRAIDLMEQVLLEDMDEL